MRARVASLTGIVFIVLLLAAFATLAVVGAEDGAPASTWGDALEQRGQWAQFSGYLHALAGISLATFTLALHGLAVRRGGRGIPTWGRMAGAAWASAFVIGGILIFASAELAGYQKHPEGAKTALILGHLMYANPVVALLGAAFAIAVGRAGTEAWPAWFGTFSLSAGGFGMLITLLGGVGGIGLLGMGPVALWLVVAAVAAPVWRFTDAPPPARSRPHAKEVNPPNP